MNIFPGAKTALYGIIGHPVGHSLSPAMHNAAFRTLNLDAVYLAFDVVDLKGAMAGVRALGIQGLSVTVPHKEAVMAHLDELDPVARRIGAVNTVVRKGGQLKGLNTDWLGAVKALQEEVAKLTGKQVLLIGAGGAARAILAGLREMGARVHVANRTEERAKRLSEPFGATWSGLEIPEDLSFDILINTTTLGMAGENQDKMPVSEAVIKKADIVMDIVYSPLETKLLKTAKTLSKTTVNGLRMLLHQAVAQFEIWTGERAPIETMESALSGRLVKGHD